MPQDPAGPVEQETEGRSSTPASLRRLRNLLLAAPIYGGLTGLATLGNLLFWGHVWEPRTLWAVLVHAAGGALAFVALAACLPQRWRGQGPRAFLLRLALLTALTLLGANLVYAVANYVSLPHAHQPIWTKWGLLQFLGSIITGQAVYALMAARLLTPFTLLALLAGAWLAGRDGRRS